MNNTINIEHQLSQLNNSIRNYCIGSTVANIRNKLGLSLDDVAYRLHILPSELALYENGDKELTPVILFNLSSIFGVKISDFFVLLDDSL